uniref:Sister chromatid cohesion protein DCC1 n=1 Tax=Ciona savignyi TaxID=51511 RepID=H2ZPM6_CIOSA
MAEIISERKNMKLRIELAKMDLSDLRKPAQILDFAKDANDQEFTLLQLDADVLKVIENGGNLIIRGNEDDSAVLCTDDSTYNIKRALTSNKMLLIPECTREKEQMPELFSSGKDEEIVPLHRDVVGWSSEYLELKRIHPQTTRLVDLLKQNYYKGPQHEQDDGQKSYTLSELLEEVQASEVEVMTYLCKLNACCVDGRWRLLDFGYLVDCMGELFQLIDSESWSCGSVPFIEATQKINDSGELVPTFILKHLLGSYGSQIPTNDGIVCYAIDEAKVCRLFAEMLLRDVQKFNLSEFLDVWKYSVPAGMVTNEKYLLGLALVDKCSNPHTVKLFKVDQLPLDMDARFNALFDVKEKWTFEQIEPYIEDVCIKGQTVSAMLTKYARASNLNGVKVYSTRKSGSKS